jgi:hypothetical protein
VKTIAVLPANSDEIRNLHDQAKGYAAELLAENEPFEIKSFTPFITKNDQLEMERKLPNASSRRHAFSVGLEMLNDDKKDLPRLSSEQILAYLRTHFVSIQARIYREPVSRSLYLGPRCFAATHAFQDFTLSKAFFPTVAESVNNFRSLGLLVQKREAPTPSNLRTLVLVHKNHLSVEGGPSSTAKTNFEYLFIRGQDARQDELKLHSFATSDERTKLNWLKPGNSPTRSSDCSIRGAIRFTEFSNQGLYPKSAVVRRSLISGLKTLPWEFVDKFSRKTSGQPALENIPRVLDAIISGELQVNTL